MLYVTLNVILTLLFCVISTHGCYPKGTTGGQQGPPFQPPSAETISVTRGETRQEACDANSLDSVTVAIGENRTYPDIGYAMYGYNILKGYPLEVGSDPGFTHPIFKAEYRRGQRSADLRSLVPDGYLALEDVACTTSFSSETTTNTKQLDKSLSASAQASGGGWGVQFSASAGYQKASSQLSSGKGILIISSAHCIYYTASLNMVDPPLFESSFLHFASELENGTSDKMQEFLDYYGTHFLMEITFFAKYSYVHEMSSSNYLSMLDQGIDVSVSASYSGMISAGGGFGLTSKQVNQASEFSEKVKTTTASLGAPPPSNGDALTWASTVKENPLPVRYKLSSIEELFTDRFMKDQVRFNYSRVKENIEEAKRSGNSGVESGIVIPNTLLNFNIEGTLVGYRYRDAEPMLCIEDCLRDTKCVAVSICPTKSLCSGWTCVLYVSKYVITARRIEGVTTYIFPSKLAHSDYYEIENARLPVPSLSTSFHAEDSAQCSEGCMNDPKCDVCVFCDPNNESWCRDQPTAINCLLYPRESVMEIVLENKLHYISPFF